MLYGKKTADFPSVAGASVSTSLFCSQAYAHHGADVASELPLWQLIAIGAVLAAVFLLVKRLKLLIARRRRRTRVRTVAR